MRWRPPGLDGFRVARDMVSCQTFWTLGRGLRHAGQAFMPGLTNKLRLQVGHLTFMSLILLLLPMGDRPVSWNHLVSQYRTGERVWQGKRGDSLIAKVWSSSGVLVFTWGCRRDCHRSALPVRTSCSKSILASTLSRRPPS